MAVIQENLTLIHMNAEVGRKVSMYFKTADVAGLRIFYREDAICRRIRRLGDGGKDSACGSIARFCRGTTAMASHGSSREQ